MGGTTFRAVRSALRDPSHLDGGLKKNSALATTAATISRKVVTVTHNGSLRLLLAAAARNRRNLSNTCRNNNHCDSSKTLSKRALQWRIHRIENSSRSCRFRCDRCSARHLYSGGNECSFTTHS